MKLGVSMGARSGKDRRPSRGAWEKALGVVRVNVTEATLFNPPIVRLIVDGGGQYPMSWSRL